MASITESDPSAGWATWEANVNGPYLVARAFISPLERCKIKTLVFMSSVGAWLVNPGFSHYQTSKLALTRFADFVNAEYGEGEGNGKGLLTFCVHPGNVPGTEIFENAGVPEAVEHDFMESPELVAGTVAGEERRDWLAGRYISAT